MASYKFPKCILHIGIEKTGTTTLQTFLGAHRDALLRRGLFVPKALSPYSKLANHERLTTYALRLDKLNDDLRIAAGLKSREDVVKHRSHVLQHFEAEIISTRPEPATTLLVSNEHCHSRLVEMDEVAALRDLLMTFSEQIKIIVYLRPQHELATSLYDQALKAGYFDIEILPFLKPTGRQWVSRRYFQYDDLLKRWTGIFGQENVRAKLFDRKQLYQNNIIDDFFREIGASCDGLERTADKNRTIGRTFQRALNAINRFASNNPGAITPVIRERLIELFSDGPKEAGKRPLREEAKIFLKEFGLGNEYVREKFFPSLPALFEPDMSDFPDQREPEISESDALIRALLHLLSKRKWP